MTTVVAAVIESGRKVLVCQRSPRGSHPLKWEFPGGKVEAGEFSDVALQRELQEELGILAVIGPEITRYIYTYADAEPITLIFYTVKVFTSSIRNQVFEQIAWADPQHLTSFDFLEGDVAFVLTFIELAKAGL